MSKKKEVILSLFRHCQTQNNFIFDNQLVKHISEQVGFKNPFDATKVDSQRVLPNELLDADYALIHLGNGRHQFIRGVRNVYHPLEPIQTKIDWPYRKSLLNNFNSSEANMLSVANNQGILHDFLFGAKRNTTEVLELSRTYFPHRTKTNLNYYFGTIPISLEHIQIEIDLTIEFQGTIGIFEAKNGRPTSFSIYQLYHPYLYYHKAKQKIDMRERINAIKCVYVVRRKEKMHQILSLYLYDFENPLDINSIQLEKSVEYRLIEENPNE